MAKRSKKKGADLGSEASVSTEMAAPDAKSGFWRWISVIWLPFLLAAITAFIYAPSIGSAFVYDAHVEILQEGFITSLANLPAVL